MQIYPPTKERTLAVQKLWQQRTAPGTRMEDELKRLATEASNSIAAIEETGLSLPRLKGIVKGARIARELHWVVSQFGVWPHSDYDEPTISNVLIVQNGMGFEKGHFVIQDYDTQEFPRTQDAGTVVQFRGDELHWLAPFGKLPSPWVGLVFDTHGERHAENPDLVFDQIIQRLLLPQ